jgi:hypothetical protein
MTRIPAISAALVVASAAAYLSGQTTATRPAQTQPSTAPASELMVRVSEEYLSGKWDDLEKELKAPAKDFAGLSAGEQADVKYIRQTLSECRPAWWAKVKTGKKVSFQAALWGRTLNCTYDPNTSGVQVKSTPTSVQSVTFGWPAADMDNPEHAEHGFSKGDLNNLGVWANVSFAQVLAGVPSGALANRDQTPLERFIDFRGCLAGIYYGTPKARRWGLWLCLAYHMDKYAKAPTVEARKAIGAMFMAEVLAHPQKYPSLKPPASFPTEAVESKLADHFRNLIEKQTLTLAEDMALREAIKAFAVANEKTVYPAGKVAIAPALTHMLDADQDAPFRAKRETWLKEQFEKAGK